MRIGLRKTVHRVMPLVVALAAFIVGVCAFYFYAAAAAFLFQPHQSTPETIQTLTTRAAAPPVFMLAPPAPPPPTTPSPTRTTYQSQPVCENCIQDESCGLCERVTGEYMNSAYDYTLTIPDELRALRAPAEAKDYGFVARLAADPEALIEVEGTFNEELWKSVNEAVNAHIEYLKSSATDVVVRKRGVARLGKRGAVRYVVQYTNISTGVSMIEDKVIALRKDGEEAKEWWKVYAVSLQTPASRYERNIAALEKVLGRWREMVSGC
jgi:hypothetical protein